MYWTREAAVVEKTKTPMTKQSLMNDLERIGLKSGSLVLVHNSMSEIGWIVGGEITVIESLMDCITKEGTLIMPTHSSWNSDPANWNHPPVPKDWWQIIRENMPPYIPEISPTRGMGRIPELFRTLRGVHRSCHPSGSFAAWGKLAKEIVKEHPINRMFGLGSPLDKIYSLDGEILLIGADHSNNTSLHYAEARARLANHPTEKSYAAILEDGKRIWAEWEDIAYINDDFAEIGDAFEKLIKYEPMLIGQAESRLFKMRELVDYGAAYMRAKRRFDEP